MEYSISVNCGYCNLSKTITSHSEKIYNGYKNEFLKYGWVVDGELIICNKCLYKEYLYNKVYRIELGIVNYFFIDFMPDSYIADKCLFRRCTLLKYNDKIMYVSTVGNRHDEKNKKIALDEYMSPRNMIYYETYVFNKNTTHDNSISDENCRYNNFLSNFRLLNETDADEDANIMHENVVDEISKKMLDGRL